MSAATLEGIDTMEVVDLEEIFGEDVPCVYPECKDPAKWKAHLTCGHKHDVCNKHKGMLMAKIAQGPWPCAQNGEMVTKIHFEEL